MWWQYCMQPLLLLQVAGVAGAAAGSKAALAQQVHHQNRGGAGTL